MENDKSGIKLIMHDFSTHSVTEFAKPSMYS